MDIRTLLRDRDARELLELCDVPRKIVGDCVFIEDVSGEYCIKIDKSGYFNFFNENKGDYFSTLWMLQELTKSEKLNVLLSEVKMAMRAEVEIHMLFIDQMEKVFPTKN